MIHCLKIDNNYLENILCGDKKQEIRFNDRDYQKGDLIRFERYGVHCWYSITHIHSGLGLEKGYVILSIEEHEEPPI